MATTTSSTSVTNEFDDKIVGFVVASRHGKFIPMVARCFHLDDDDDCLVHVLTKADPQDTLVAALAMLDEKAGSLYRIFRAPVPGTINGHWVSTLQRAAEVLRGKDAS